MDDLQLYELALGRWVEAVFGLPKARCKHDRSVTSEVFFVEWVDGTGVLKLYGEDGRPKTEILWETELIKHLVDKGAPVAGLIFGADGKVEQDYEYPGGKRVAVLYQYAKGDKPAEPLTPAFYHNQGRSLAALHKAADSFETTQTRPPLDINSLIIQPVALVTPYMTNEDDKQFLASFAQEITQKITQMSSGLDKGPVHGQAMLKNLHVDYGGDVVWYDFDNSGVGCRALDLQGWMVLEDTPEALSDHEAFLRGYREMREIGDADVAASPYFQVANEFCRLKSVLLHSWATQDQTTVQRELQNAVVQLRTRHEQLEKHR